MSSFKVKNLEELAFDASFKAILATLLLCPGHRYGGDKRKLARCSFIPSIDCQVYKSENIRDVVKARLCQILVGIMSDEIRRKYVKKFFQIWTNELEARYCLPQIWCFLDAVLDESFTEELVVYVAFQVDHPDPRITSVIAQHCPQLQSLKIDFESPIDITCYWDPPIIMRSLIRPLSSLQNLTSLSLETLKDYHNPLLSMIGTSCPRLRRLTIHVESDNKITKKQIVLVVLLGELIDKLIPHPNYVPKWSTNEAFEYLVIPPIYLTPVCSTLDHFELQLISRRGVRETTIIGGAAPMSTLDAFAVRHLPSILLAPGVLQVVGDPGRKMGHVVMQSRFEGALRNAKAEIDRFKRIRRV